MRRKLTSEDALTFLKRIDSGYYCSKDGQNMPQARMISEAISKTLKPMQRELRQLKHDRRRSAAAAKIDNDISEGLVTPALRDWAIGCYHAQPRVYREFLAVQRELLAKADEQPEIAVCHALGISREQFAQFKAKQMMRQPPAWQVPNTDARDTEYRGAKPSAEMIDSATDDQCEKWLSPAELTQCVKLAVSPKSFLKAKLASAKMK